VGNWDGEVFVIETTGFNDQSWLDDAGLPHSDALRTTERFTRRDFGHLQVDITFTDPKSYSRPWSVTLPFDLQADTELLEHLCDNERDSARLVGGSANRDAPSLFGALEGGLGLKLESTRGAVDVLVIDHIERPTAD
jgi:hypothetical protein